MDILTKVLSFIEKNYKKFIILTIILFVIFVGAILFNYLKNGYILNKSIDISGGYVTMINNNYHITNQEITTILHQMNITDYILYDTPNIIYIESGQSINESQLIYLFNADYHISLTPSDISIQQYSSIVGNLIFNQFAEFVVIVMILVGIIIFIAFRVSNVTLNIMSTIAFDVLGLLAILSSIKYPIGANGFIAMLMILGFAIDNNVVLSTNMVKEKEKPFVERVKMSFRVGMLMEIIALYALIILYLLVPDPSVKDFSTVLSIAIALDLLYYLIGNIPIYKYFTLRKEKEEA
ncbi:protein-export membrane protein SecF [Nanoarchaeota archaeon]